MCVCVCVCVCMCVCVRTVLGSAHTLKIVTGGVVNPISCQVGTCVSASDVPAAPAGTGGSRAGGSAAGAGGGPMLSTSFVKAVMVSGALPLLRAMRPSVLYTHTHRHTHTQTQRFRHPHRHTHTHTDTTQLQTHTTQTPILGAGMHSRPLVYMCVALCVCMCAYVCQTHIERMAPETVKRHSMLRHEILDLTVAYLCVRFRIDLRAHAHTHTHTHIGMQTQAQGREEEEKRVKWRAVMLGCHVDW